MTTLDEMKAYMKGYKQALLDVGLDLRFPEKQFHPTDAGYSATLNQFRVVERFLDEVGDDADA